MFIERNSPYSLDVLDQCLVCCNDFCRIEKLIFHVEGLPFLKLGRGHLACFVFLLYFPSVIILRGVDSLTMDGLP